jgi:alkyl hydroperoxide reductase subunit AhpC
VEIPGLEKLKGEFEAANTQVLGVSIDSKFANKAWAESMGGVSYPLLSDFNPKGAMAAAYGLYLDARGITDRATVLIGKDGTVKWSESVGVPGKREASDLLARAKNCG